MEGNDLALAKKAESIARAQKHFELELEFALEFEPTQ
jgi:hypothetical protein